MRVYDYKNEPKKYLTPEIVTLISKLYEHKGKQELFIEANADDLEVLLEVAKIQSTGASNRIEGIFTTDARLEEIVKEKVKPKNRSEQEIAGYREVLQTIHENYEYIEPTKNIILQLHRDLYSFAGDGGHFKTNDNQITEIDATGERKIRFKPVSAFETPRAIENLSENFLQAIREPQISALILIPMFILDFLSIHPFNDGNGRMSRLLTLLLYYRADFIVGKYVSLEMLIEKSKETYYEALHDSSIDWHTNKNDYGPFIKYYIGILLKAYSEFEDRVEHLRYRHLSKPERIEAIIERSVGKITKKDILFQAPDISKTTVERTLLELRKKGKITKIGRGRATAYIKSTSF